MKFDQVLENGLQVGRYRLEKVLGLGSHAVVYKAFDTILNRVVALKILKPEIAADKEMFARFEREARAAANLMHPHIAWVWDIGQADGRHFLAVKYIDGVSLDEVITKRGKLPWDEALQIISEISNALDFAHSKGVIHRDIKPKNIMVSQQEGAVLTDFGLAKVLYDSTVKTSVGMVLGSPGYIPPEIWLGDPATPATDQYALACVLFEILTGRPLFGESGNFNLIIREHLEGLPLKSSWPMEIPTAAQRLMKKALSRSSTERFENLAQLMDQLKGIEIRPEKDSGDDMESLTPEEKIVKGKSSDADTPSTGIPSQEITKVHQTQATKASWRSRLRSMLSADTQKFFLKVISPVNRTFHLEMDHVIIGRDSQCGIILEGMGISRQHAALERSKDGYLIKDLGSKNGTFVNGERLKGIRRLHPGDVVDLGNAARLIYNRE